jgi:hypothetical protein
LLPTNRSEFFRRRAFFCYNPVVMRLVSLLLALLLLSATLAESFHHHDDGVDHADCSVCVAALHHSADTALPSPVLLPLPEISPTFFHEFLPESVTVRTCYAPGNRAPPC